VVDLHLILCPSSVCRDTWLIQLCEQFYVGGDTSSGIWKFMRYEGGNWRGRSVLLGLRAGKPTDAAVIRETRVKYLSGTGNAEVFSKASDLYILCTKYARTRAHITQITQAIHVCVRNCCHPQRYKSHRIIYQFFQWRKTQYVK
jgi:hypothetical protein